jgi:hypothetical protein
MGGNNAGYAKLSVCGLGFALGITNGLGMMCLAWAAMEWGFGASMVSQIAGIYHGYAATLIGGLYGAGWGFLDGLVFGVIAAVFYNLSLCCCSKKKA